MRVTVDPRVERRHPDVTPTDVEHAVLHALRFQARLGTDPPLHIGVGLDSNGRLLEWVAFRTDVDDWRVFHAMSATLKMLRELGMIQKGGRHG